MPHCVKKPEWSWIAIFCAILAFQGCSGKSVPGQFEINQVDARWANGRMKVSYQQNLVLSPEARNALVHGVPLTLEVEMILRQASNKTRVEKNTTSFEISYLPLSERYQLARKDEDDVKTYPRLRHVLAELAQLEVLIETGALPAGDYELLTRSYLDRNSMPPPMRLPALFSRNWDHDSDWSSWSLEINPGA